MNRKSNLPKQLLVIDFTALLIKTVIYNGLNSGCQTSLISTREILIFCLKLWPIHQSDTRNRVTRSLTVLTQEHKISDVSENPGKDIKIQSIGRYFKKNHIEHFGSIGLNVEFISNGGPSNPQELDGEVKIFENWTKEFCYERTYKIRWIKPGILSVGLSVGLCWPSRTVQ